MHIDIYIQSILLAYSLVSLMARFFDKYGKREKETEKERREKFCLLDSKLFMWIII